MLSFDIASHELAGRLDPGYYDPQVLAIIRALEKRRGKSGTTIRTLGSIATLRKGIFSILKEEYQESGVPFLRVTEIKDLSIDFGSIAHITKERAKTEKSTLKSGDIAISKSGTVGNVTVVPTDIASCAISQDVIGVEIHPESPLSAAYVAAFLSSTKLGRPQLLRGVTQQVQQHLNLEEARSVIVVAADDASHQFVTKAVETSQDERASARRLLAQAQALLLSSMPFAPKISEDSSFSVKSSDVGPDSLCPAYYHPNGLDLLRNLKQHFLDVFHLGQIADLKPGKAIEMSSYITEGVPVIRTSDFPDNEVDTSPDHFVEAAQAQRLKQDVKPGDILIAKDGKVGDCGLVTHADLPLVYVGHVIRARLREGHLGKLLPGYVFAFLASPYARIQFRRFTVVQSSIPTVGERLARIEIPSLDMRKQREIHDLVTQAFEFRASSKKRIRDARQRIESSLLVV